LNDLTFAIDDPGADDVRELLSRHLALMHEVTPVGHVHALDGVGLVDPAVTFFSARRDGVLLGVGAIKRLDATHAELKSMHVAAAARGQGIGRAMLEHLLHVAAAGGFTRVSLETGSNDAFAPARALYQSARFEPCGPFGDYTDTQHSSYLTRAISAR
jgi:putative acetyltransferase